MYTYDTKKFNNILIFITPMYDLKLLKELDNIPVFSLSDLNQYINNKNYAKKFLKRMKMNGTIIKVKKNKYTLNKDPFLISTFLIKPSYITSVSALSYHKLITQIPNEIYCATDKKTKIITFEMKINFIQTKYFFGFNNENYSGFNIPVADPEKAIIDSISIIPISVIEEAFAEINPEKMILYLKKIGKSSLIKRIGYLMEKYNYDVYDKLKDLINYKYVLLDPCSSSRGKKEKKWGLIINSR